jgi:tetratricopeptide (TPR) repeat protein
MTVLTVFEAERAAKAALDAGQFQKTEALTRALLSKGDGQLHVWLMLVASLRRQGKHREALPILEHLVQMVPQNYELHFDLAEMYLSLGDFERGWREYRFRYHLRHTRPLDRKVQLPMWEGEAIPGKTLLIHDEQGYGDTFQFIRMVSWAKQRSGARIVLQVDPKQLSFARRLNVADEVVVRGQLPPAFDCHCQMMDLPMAMGLKLSDLPGTIPYLSADPDRLKTWKTRLADLPRPLVSLCWAGRPEHFNDAARSLNLVQLAPLAASGATFISVQKGPRAVQAQTPPSGMKVIDFGDDQADFDDTAAILMASDLLISIDSSPAHLAGALGRPVWLLLSRVPDWRWLLERNDSPWYPAHRLFRQRAPNDWQPVIEAIAEALKSWRPDNGGMR